MYFGSVNLSQKFSWLKRKFSRLRTNGNASFLFPFFYRIYVIPTEVAIDVAIPTWGIETK